MILWKVWETGDRSTYVVEAESADIALATVRKINPKANTTQACDEKEERFWRESQERISKLESLEKNFSKNA